MPEHTVITMQSGGSDPPRDYLLASLFNLLVLGNPCCLSFAALVYSVKSRDRKMVGDINGALTYAETSKKLNIGALAVNLVVLLIVIIVVFTYVIPLFNSLQKRHG